MQLWTQSEYFLVSSAEPSPWSHLAAHSVVSTAWEELGRAMPMHEARQVLQLCERGYRKREGQTLHIGRVARAETADLGGNTGCSGSRRSAGDGRLGESADSECEESSGVLHLDYWVA